MTLFDLLKKEKAAIYEHWLAQTFQTYPKDTAVFLEKQKDRFANPVGYTISEGLRELLDIIAEQKDVSEASSHLEAIVKIRSLQGQKPSQALSFVYLPKKIVREYLKAQIEKLSLSKDLERFDERVDALALEAFDIYMSCREKLSDIRVNEVKRQVSQILRRTGFVDIESSSEPANQEGDRSPGRPLQGGDR